MRLNSRTCVASVKIILKRPDSVLERSNDVELLQTVAALSMQTLLLVQARVVEGLPIGLATVDSSPRGKLLPVDTPSPVQARVTEGLLIGLGSVGSSA